MLSHKTQTRLRTYLASVACLTLIVALLGETASAATALLVNTESFELIDAGDGTTDIELRFGTSAQALKYLTSGKFQFTRGLSVQGNLSGSSLRIDNGADIWGTLGVSGATVLKSTLKVNSTAKVLGTLSGSSLQVDNNAAVYGQLSVSGALKTRGDLTINSEAGAADAVLNFGNTTANQTLKFNNATQRFEFSTGLSVHGTLTGSHLRIDRNADIWGNLGVSGSTIFNRVPYTWPNSQGAADTFLKNDGNGNLSWGATTVSPSSGNILSLHPVYPNTTYTASGASAVGQLSHSGALGNFNMYQWTTSKGTLQDYWLATRIQVPAGFTHFETASGITVRLRTATTNAADNYATIRVLDTAGATVATGNNASLRSTVANAWRVNSITNLASGTYTPLGYITLLIKLAATSTGRVDLGNIDIRWSRSVP